MKRFSLGLTSELIEDADKLAVKLSEESGGKWHRSDVIRAALKNFLCIAENRTPASAASKAGLRRKD